MVDVQSVSVMNAIDYHRGGASWYAACAIQQKKTADAAERYMQQVWMLANDDMWDCDRWSSTPYMCKITENAHLKCIAALLESIYL